MSDENQVVIAVDLDDTIADASLVQFPEIGPPKKGVREALRKFQDKGYVVRIYTCRMNGSHEGRGQFERVAKYLKDHRIPYDDIVLAPEGKPFADFYIDDKAVRMTDWDSVSRFVVDSLNRKLASKTASEAMMSVRVALRTTKHLLE